jgi:NAD(P)H-dependent flavin oxidoreductase YrpB (nitropropane dioxygenase family)
MREQVFSTPITELFGIRHPILCGGMLHLSDARYVAAVVNAGGMAFIGAWNFRDPKDFLEQVRLCGELTEGKPFGVNISVSRRPGVNEMLKPHVDITINEGVRFVETSGSSPAHILGPLHDAGVKVIHKVPSVRYGLTAQREGVDAITVVGAECGGHPGYMMTGTMVQAALATEAINLPLVLGGGIGTGRQIMGALAMGADGALLGSRMLAAKELWSHPDYKQLVVESDEKANCIVMSSFRRHHRVLRNRAAEEVLELEARGVDDIEAYADLISGEQVRKAYETGDYSIGMLDFGQSVVFANKLQSVEEIYDELIDDLVQAKERVAKLIE